MQLQFEVPQSRKPLLIFVASLVITAALSPALVKALDRCFPDLQTPAAEAPNQASPEVNWDIRSMWQ